MTRSVCFISNYAYGYFEPDTDFEGGGAERQIYLLSTALADELDVHIVVGDFGQPEQIRREGVTLHRGYPLQPRQNPVQPAKHLAQLYLAMRRAGADVYVHRGSPRNAAFAYLLTRTLRSKWVYNVANDSNISADPDVLPMPVEMLYRHMIRNSNALIAQTEYQQRQLHSEYGVDSEVVPNGYPPAENPPVFEERGPLLWVGRLEREQKRPHLFLDIAEQVETEKFVMAGPAEGHGEYAERVVERAESLSNVQYLGLVPPDEIHEQYRRAAALVNTSAHEGFPNTFLEAWRQATPVVSLDVNPDRYLKTGESLFKPAEDIPQLATRCRELCENRSTWMRLSDSCLSAFESRYSIEPIAKRYGDVIQSTIAENNI
jgi:glycosyltransferase involved in cell wall biosynthesis